MFFHFLSFSFIFCHFLSFSFIFFHFLSFSFVFFPFLSFSFIFVHFLSFSFIFFDFLSFFFIFHHFSPFFRFFFFFIFWFFHVFHFFMKKSCFSPSWEVHPFEASFLSSPSFFLSSFSFLSFVSGFKKRCFLRGRCSMEMWCPDDTGGIAGIGLGRLLGEEHASTPQSGVEAPRL